MSLKHHLHLENFGFAGQRSSTSTALFISTVRRRAPRALALFASVMFALCAQARAQSNYNVVAQMEIGAPASASFVLHGTLPLPPGKFPRADHKLPIALLDHDGSVVDTQLEIVSRYPKASDGADVVEILGRVRVPANTALGTRLVYKVVEYPHFSTPRQLTPTVTGLLLQPGTVMIVGKDCFGYSYATDLTPAALPSPSVTVETLKNGIGATQVSVYGTMLPQTTNIGAPSGALDHMFGVHGFYTAWQGEDVVSLDMRVNNGASGLDTTTPIDNPLGSVYFESLELWVKSGWNLLQQGSDPMFGSSRSQGTWTAYSLVEPNANGALHFMPSQGQFIRRLALCKIGQEVKARAILDGEGLAFCKRGVSPTGGHELYSWWNPLTARYFPQRHRLPELDHIGAVNIRTKLKGQLQTLEAAITTGQPSGVLSTANLGWAHPWGVKYGGMTGGAEIFIFDGILAAEAASNEGYRLAQLTQRAYNDRQPDALYNLDGGPTELTDWVRQGPNGPYVNMYFSQKLLAGPDPFGFAQASKHQVNWVVANNKKPAYETTLAAYKPIDLQHIIRATRSMKVLAWLGNDSLAKQDLLMRAEIFRLSYHHLANSGTNKAQGGGLLDQVRFVALNPGCGLKVGRAEGWGIDTVNAAYAFADPTYRAAVMPWFQSVIATYSRALPTCNSFLQSQVNAKQLSGLFYQRQQYELSIIENGLRGTLESVVRGVDAAAEAAVRGFLDDQIHAMITPMSWDPVQRGPWKNMAMAPLNSQGSVFCGFNPVGGTSPGVEKFQNWSSYAYGYAIRGDQTLLDYAALSLGGTLLGALKNGGYSNLESRAALLALAQRP